MDAPLRFASLVPAQLLRLLDAAEQDLPCSTACAASTGCSSAARRRRRRCVARALELGLNVTRTYGSSETSGGCVYDGVPLGRRRGAHRRRRGAARRPDPGRGLSRRRGAHRRSASSTTDGTRWYPHRRRRRARRRACCSVTGRLDDVIISGGVKVSLAAVERLVRALPGLADAVAVRAPSAEWGEVPVVFTRLAAVRMRGCDELRSARAGRARVPPPARPR